MARAAPRPPRRWRHGGERLVLQFLADMLGAPVERPAVLETTALGAAYLAGLATGVWSGLDAITGTWARAAVFVPKMSAARRAQLVAGWHLALRRALQLPPEKPAGSA